MSRMNEKYYFVLLAFSLLNRAQPNTQTSEIQVFKSDVCSLCLLSSDKKNVLFCLPTIRRQQQPGLTIMLLLWHNIFDFKKNGTEP